MVTLDLTPLAFFDHLMPSWLFWSLVVIYVIVGSFRKFNASTK